MKEFKVLVDSIDKQVYTIKAKNKEKAIKKAMSIWYQKIAHPEILDCFEAEEIKGTIFKSTDADKEVRGDKMAEVKEEKEDAPEEETKEEDKKEEEKPAAEEEEEEKKEEGD